jgi:hypothetical protein
MKKSILSSALLLALGFSLVSCNEKSQTTSDSQDSDGEYFEMNASGDLIRPSGYRSWIYVGTPVTPNDMNGGKAAFPEMHNVYIDPKSYEHWKEKGEWREGTILIKELTDVGSKAAVSGKGYFMGEFIGLEATIKSKQHFPDEPGNWAYFSFTNPTGGTLKNEATAFKAASCNACHDSSADDDFVFTQYYPVLSAAKGVGKNTHPENVAKRKASAPESEAKKKTSKWEPTAPTPLGLELDLPLDKQALFDYLSSGKYKAFRNKASAMHESAGPHQSLGHPVRVFMNDTVADSLAAGNAEHPKGSAIVKEMFTPDGDPNGWAVMAKTHEKTDEGKGWFWYEVTSNSDATKIAAVGNGVYGCAVCHTNERDMVKTTFPLE